MVDSKIFVQSCAMCTDYITNRETTILPIAFGQHKPASPIKTNVTVTVHAELKSSKLYKKKRINS